MTDRYNALTVCLDHDIRKDDAEALFNAIMTLRGVLKVEPNVVSMTDWIAEERACHHFRQKIFQALETSFKEIK